MARINPTGKGGSLLDNGVAALAALASGFLVYAMPEGLFSRIVVASRLPQFLAAAQPPLGMKARLAVIALVVLVAYAFVWTLMRALDAVGRKPRPVFVPDAEPEAPRLRRADAHPDAPSRRPIFAGRDLGEPEEALDDFAEPLELDAEAAYEPEPEAPYAPQPEPAFEPEPESASEPLPAFLVPQQPEPESWQTPEPEGFEEPVVFAPQPAFRQAEAPAAWHQEEPVDEFGAHEDEAEDEEAEEGDESSEADDQSLARLMKRFESGLSSKQQALVAPPPVQVPAVEPEPLPQERVGHRLRSAISDLGKMSAPGR
jgi:hypothetical protein